MSLFSQKMRKRIETSNIYRSIFIIKNKEI